MTKRELVRVISTRFTDGLPPKFLRNLISQPIVDLAKLNFRQHLSYLVLATALPLLALSLVLFGRMVHAEREATRTGLMTNVRTMASLVDNEVSDHAAIAATLAHSSALKRGDLATFWQSRFITPIRALRTKTPYTTLENTSLCLWGGKKRAM